MTTFEFAAAILDYADRYAASISSWKRTTKRSILVGGFEGDPHTWGLGADFIYDDGPNRPGASTHSRSPHSCPGCADFGLKIIHEKSHDHAQPMDFPAGKVTKYPVV